MKNLLSILILLTVFIAGHVVARNYEVPPSVTTSLSTPYISDEAMEKCVILYNETKWLEEEISGIQVDRYSQASVDAYNEKSSRFNKMTDLFNRDCAGKQSESAYRAALELNKK